MLSRSLRQAARQRKGKLPAAGRVVALKPAEPVVVAGSRAAVATHNVSAVT
jgi:hypothetical protein